ATKLLDIFTALSNGQMSEIELSSLSFVCPIADVSLLLKVGMKDKGISQISEQSFECILSITGWENARYLTEPFCDSNHLHGYQWLYDLNADMDLLLSTDGKW
ncbi:MAG: hypothetical protein GY860_22855, partial [Desulfobacteraceae bacterium]|nr:hypothetical protein [Desulfobacteraceae bacterium]